MRAALTAGSTFAAAVLLGFGAGLWLSRTTGQPLWAIGGLFAGVLSGGFIAMRALFQAGK
ncbi:MAG: AtpZ/AtpI family protein [bacterium]|nr:AtpZ/AtpI family protein [bacterium]